MLRGSLRTTKDNWRLRLYTSFNPGGLGHAWVKETFVEPYRSGQETETRFFPSTYRDNPYLTYEYVSYLKSLQGQLGQAWRDGNFDIFAGQFFVGWNPEKHLIDPVVIPSYWLRFRSMDWGSVAPAVIYWFAVSDGYYDFIPRGALVAYREWYVARKVETGWVGLHLSAQQLAEEIKQREAGEHIAYGVGGQDMFIHRSGPSIAEVMSEEGVNWRQADNRRIPGWDQMRQRLNGLDSPMLYFFRTCTHAARTIPAMIQKEIDLEDIDDNLEDHCAEASRYACMSRPWVAVPKVPDPHFGTSFKSLIRKR